jgi:hypothetical protein
VSRDGSVLRRALRTESLGSIDGAVTEVLQSRCHVELLPILDFVHSTAQMKALRLNYTFSTLPRDISSATDLELVSMMRSLRGAMDLHSLTKS